MHSDNSNMIQKFKNDNKMAHNFVIKALFFFNLDFFFFGLCRATPMAYEVHRLGVRSEL